MIIERYQDMRAEDPAQAEDFKKQMTERFQKIDVSGDGDDSEEYKDQDGYQVMIVQVPEDGAGS